MVFRVGTAEWSLPAALQDRFPPGGSHLERYARVFNATEINRTFRRLPRAATVERWRDTVPDHFRFAVKCPRSITHDRRLVDVRTDLARFLDWLQYLGPKLGPVLIQLPPSLAFDPGPVATFLEDLRGRFPGAVVLEPRHATWFTRAAEHLLAEHRVTRVAADPAVVPAAAQPGGYRGLAYFRLHGAPVMYRSAYRDGSLDVWVRRVQAAAEEAQEVWCIFDNTASGAATGDALMVWQILQGGDA